MESLEIMNSITIDDLKYHELRQILSYLSVRQLFNCLTVCQKWQQIISELLVSQKVLSLNYNDINHFTNEGYHQFMPSFNLNPMLMSTEINAKCDNWRHFAVRSSVGRVLGKQSIIATFVTPSFQKIRQKLFGLFDFCPNIQSLDLCEYSLQISDIDILLSRCPQLECLSITSDEMNWTKFLCPKVSGLKHFSVSLATKTPIYGVHEKPLQLLEYENKIQMENLIINRPQINAITLNILSSYLQIIVKNIKKFHFVPSHKMSELEALDLIRSLTCVESHKSVVKDLNLNVFVFNDLFEALNKSVPNVETLYLHFNIESTQNDSLKKLKKLQKLYMDFNSNVNIFAFEEGLNPESVISDNHFINVLSIIPPTLQKLILFDASLSLSAFIQTQNYLLKLEELELIYVMFENDCQQCFWEVISNLKSLRVLTLNTTDISDEGVQHLTSSESLEVLELVKYKGPNAAQTLIDSIKVIEVFGQLAILRSNKWFELRLDIDVFEVTQEIRRLVPPNMRLINVGSKK